MISNPTANCFSTDLERTRENITMPAFHNYVEFFMIFIIAYLINRHLSLMKEYETLQKNCAEQKEGSCFHCDCEQVSPLLQRRTTQSLNISPSSSSSLSRHVHGAYITEQEASSESLKSQSLLYPSISSSYPPDFVVNAIETATTENEIAEKSREDYVSEEMKKVFIPETEVISDGKIPSIRSSKSLQNKSFDGNALRVQQNDRHTYAKLNSSLPHSSTSAHFFLHSSTSLPILKENRGKETLNNFYYNLPVEETNALTGFNHKDVNKQNKWPAMSSTDDYGSTNLKNVDASETSVYPIFTLEDFSQKATASVPLHPSTSASLLISSRKDDATPQTTEEEAADSVKTLMDETYDVFHPESITTPHQLHPFDYGVFAGDSETGREAEDSSISSEILVRGKTAYLTGGSSAECSGVSPGQKHCTFRNICYNAQKKDFIFFKGPSSVVEVDGQQGLTDDNFVLSLSTIADHNAMMFSLITFPVDVLESFSVSVINKKSIAINRFKPDNIMHVLHDDVLPLYRTLQQFQFPKKEGVFDAVIVFTDSYDHGDYFDLYSSISSNKPLSLQGFFNDSQQLICFSDIHIGLMTSTVWYQYGFLKPQGPIPDMNSQAFFHIQKGSQIIRKSFHADCFLCNQKDYLVLLSRKDNRLIANEGNLIVSLSQSTRLKVLSVSLEMHSLAEIITIVSSSKGIIGMHGSLLSVAIFLPPGGIIIELFPFAVNPSHYTPFKALSQLPGSSIIYRSWVNLDRRKSVPHPDRSPQEGGIQHLPFETQEEIKSQTEVPEHLCCEDPSWLYHIYQDTVVNVSSVVSLTLQALKAQAETLAHPIENPQLPQMLPDIPGSVEGVQCVRNSARHLATEERKVFTVSWLPHWGLKYHPSPPNLRYQVIVQEQHGSFDERNVHVFTLDVLSLSFDPFPKSDASIYYVWITVIMADGGAKSQSRHVICHL